MPGGHLWERVVDEFGLTERRGGWFMAKTARGRIHGIPVVLRWTTYFGLGQPAIVVEAPLGTVDHIGVMRISGEDARPDPTVATGDETFDDMLWVTGDPVRVKAAFQARVRQLIVLGSVKAWDGKFRAKFSTRNITPLEAVRLLEEVPLLIESLTLRSPAYAWRLTQNALEDPVPLVRLQSLLAWQSLPSTSDPDVVEKVIRGILTDSAIATATRVKAFTSALRMQLTQETKLEFAAYALRCSTPSLVAEGARALGALQAKIFTDTLCALESTDFSVLEGVADALGDLGGPAAERRLIELISRGGSRLQLRVAKALGRCGTLRAVEPLLPIGRGIFESPALRASARAAVAAIQSRAGTADAGRVSLAAPTTAEGALSDAGTSGAVSTTRPDEK